MRRAVLAIVTTLLVALRGAAAQTTLQADARVRVSLRDGHPVIGRLAEVRGDTLVVIRDGVFFHPTYRLAPDVTTRVDVSQGKYVSSGYVLAGMLLGLGGAFVFSMLNGPECSGDVCSSELEAKTLFLGGVAGALLPVAFPIDRWEPIPRPIRLGLGGGLRHGRLGGTIAF
jgi:hypothetical protein